MKLLFIVNVDWFFVSHRLPIAQEALKQGYKVTLACYFTEHKQELIDMGFNVVDLPFTRSGGSIGNEMKTIKAIRNLVIQQQPSVIHAVTIKPILYTGLALKNIKKDIPFVAAISGLGYVFTAKTLRAKVTKLIASVFYNISLSQKYKTVIFQNASDEAILTEVAKLKLVDKTLIKGSGADLSVYKYLPESTDDTIKIVMACRLLKEKGVYQYVDAAKIVKNQHPSAEFLLVGTPDLENPNSIKKTEIDKWVSEGTINYLGHSDNIPNVFSQSNIVCLPSFYGEGVPKVLIEAAACGRAIVTTDNPGCRDAVIEDETGLTVPIRDAKALAAAILKLIEQPELRISMGAKARVFAEKEFDVNSVVNKHLEIYNNLLSRVEK
ncbi:Lipid carrier : UDP-N-acetylgalactosaminyltransferase / Alpha-1,3-N-acetylgalactosamine transferase PglA; Putative glycosyltransferase [Vibrio cholerae]|uniref:glycosyltransferase family 4 protein n=1 Tax=Vibrio cholerae TaxID=666 RepID=UPI000619038D|nr:glycosyltransferase family 4 protein [Vibrio cholerae]CFW10477.1 Lipid carrier : UDP-N-acetylgalactosaminyltransferase / Alpha-1,3-N-acetylgalactosamine transferase PglA; Putative glycosyltransferase [Vibrio cholerae]CPR25473.1 Lipid carrier : UDP-N-acetylgalactosaminyltransferase / Alpha-1,3-N-acetylgalactosamine transferase PglA; Putative glycosyltransferase [Vibrio cholerae]CPR25474.1 Lipid carrier : UDP-N-acetylgalactosaminyltransferase / Alpha-1,3-N-acetylgalactosamine transferase PglA; 